MLVVIVDTCKYSQYTPGVDTGDNFAIVRHHSKLERRWPIAERQPKGVDTLNFPVTCLYLPLLSSVINASWQAPQR
jgi:hypothetical protein